MNRLPILRPGTAILSLLAALSPLRSAASDFSDPADILAFKRSQNATHTTFPELNGSIESASTAKPGWYGLMLKQGDGKLIKVIVSPATKFFKDYAPIEPAAAYPQLAQGAKVRALHNPENDVVLHTIIVTDLMFETPPVELAGTIKAAASPRPGVFDLTVSLAKGGERRLSIDEKTKFYQDYKPIDAARAYPQLAIGRKIRALEKPAPGGQRQISDVMFVDR